MLVFLIGYPATKEFYVLLSEFLIFSILFYSLLKIHARFAIKIYLRRILINNPEVLKKKGSLFSCCKSSGLFLEGMIITTLFDHPVHSLARDAFKNKWAERLLKSIQLLPVYRSSEGSENLNHNYTTFDACQETSEKMRSYLFSVRTDVKMNDPKGLYTIVFKYTGYILLKVVSFSNSHFQIIF